MRPARNATARLLRWYPPAWRQRYGPELMVLMEDALDGGSLTWGFRCSIAWAGLRERAHAAELVGEGSSLAARTRAGALLVLCAWTAFVLGGASFSKASEHFARALPAPSRAVPQDAFDVVVALGIAGCSFVMLGALAALPAVVSFVRRGGWSALRGHVLRGAVLSATTIGSMVLLSSWAHHLSAWQRNGGDGAYSAAIAVGALVAAATLAQWTATGVSAVRRVELGTWVLGLEAALAVLLAGAMVAMTVAVGIWWATVADAAPGFLGGRVGRIPASPFSDQLVLTLSLMLVAAVVAAYGVFRILHSSARIRAT